MKDTPLIRAAHNGHLHVVQYLLEQGAEVNAMDLARAHHCHSSSRSRAAQRGGGGGSTPQ